MIYFRYMNWVYFSIPSFWYRGGGTLEIDDNLCERVMDTNISLPNTRMCSCENQVKIKKFIAEKKQYISENISPAKNKIKNSKCVNQSNSNSEDMKILQRIVLQYVCIFYFDMV